MNRLAMMLLMACAMSVAHAAEGDVRAFGEYGNSEEDACKQAKTKMHSDGYKPEGSGACYDCEAQHKGDMVTLSGKWFCRVKGVEQKKAIRRLVFPTK